MNPQALSRFTVLDLTRVRAGPTAVRQLADWGANVIKIEMPPTTGEEGLGGPRHGPDFQNLHRNKRSMTLNLKHPDGMALFKQMATKADVIVENYRPNVKNRLGIDYEAIAEINPGIVYGSISGFGQDGPYVGRPGVDQIAQGMGGLMSITGLPGQGPVRVGVPIADLASGLYCALGILAALLERDRSGKGQWVHTSLLESQISMLDFQAARWTIGGEVPPQAGNNHPTIIPQGVFQTSDGHINIAAAADHLYARLCTVIGAPELIEDERFNSAPKRLENRDELNAQIEVHTVKNTSAHWVEAINEAGVPCGPIYSIDQTFGDAQVKHLGMARAVKHKTLGDVHVIDNAVNMSRTPSQMTLATPECGEHTDEILGEFGFDAEGIANFRAEGVV
ncbi:MAG: CoA transferase [Gammaproteobacteria bacterium]|nr:CoA transferase [Gammaproteobacteria bacterium]